MNSITLPVAALLLVTPLSIAIGQVLFKMTSEKLVESNAPYYAIALNPIFILAVAIYGAATLLWIYVLKTVPLSYAYSFMALSFVFVPIFAFFIFKESFTVRYFIGALMILGGLLVIQQS